MDQIKTFIQQFAELSVRERILAALAVVGVAFFVVDFFWVRPELARAKVIRQSLDQRSAQLAVLDEAVRSQAPPSRKAAIAALQAQREQLRQTLEKGQFIFNEAATDKRLAEVIRTVAASRPGLTLVSLNTVPSQIFYKPSVAAATPPAAAASTSKVEVKKTTEAAPLPVLYKHGVEVVLRGQYSTLVPFLAALEKGASGVFWGDSKLEAGQYPEATLKLTLFALSVQPELQLQ